MLEKYKMIRKEKLPHNKKTNIYLLTEKGLKLTPTIVELALWGDHNLRENHPSIVSDNRIEILKNNKEATIKMLVDNYKTENWLQ
jgi:DNA-binding HxlR family transcriptional regulator